MKLLTIIVPVYNEEELIIRALNSIPVRDDIEVIIIDDGSTDNTLKVCENWLNQTKLDAKVISYEKNKGLGYAKNVGYDNANGKYINELDSDDFLYTEEYEKALKELNDEDIVYVNLKTNNNYVFEFNDETKIKWGSGCARFIKREFLGDTRCPNVRYAEDWYLSSKLNNKNPKEKYTGIIAYHYNHPRKESLTGGVK